MEQRYVIGIGAQKAGTTWLGDYFSRHPEVLMSPIKELHFFDVKYRPDLCRGFDGRFLNAFKTLEIEHPAPNTAKGIRLGALKDRVNMNGDILEYQDYFTKRANSEKIFCEITPEYSLLDTMGYEAIKSLSGDVKIIFLMRNPVDRFWSALRMWNKKKPNLDVVKEIDDFLINPQFVERTDYQKTIEKIYQVFEPSNILVEFYENLFLPESLKRICDFSGISYVDPDFGKKVHEGVQKEIDPEIKIKILTKFGPLYEWAQQKYGDELPEPWLNDLYLYKDITIVT